MTDPRPPRGGEPAYVERCPRSRTPDRSGPGVVGGRRLARVCGGAACILAWSGTASAHGGAAYGSVPVDFPVVLWVPVVAGLLGGLVAVRYRTGRTVETGRRRVTGTFGVLLIVLGGAFGIAAVTTRPLLGAGSGCVGGLTALLVARRAGGRWESRDHHADLTLGGACTHRVLEGAAVGALSVASASVGVVGVLVIAGHTALETAAVGGLYTPRRGRAFAAIVLVQVGYAVGALAGVGASLSVPGSVHSASVGLTAGVFLIAGAEEVRHSSTTPPPGGVSDP